MTRRPEAETRVPDVLVERYRLGELTQAEMAVFRDWLHTDDALRRRVHALEASDEEISRQYPPAVMAAGIRHRLSNHAGAGAGRLSRWRWSAAAGLAAGILLIVVIAPPLLLPRDEGDRIKGLEPALELFRKLADGSEPLEDGARVREGDLIRVGYRAAGQQYGVILSIDGRGVVTMHLPQEGTKAARLSADDQVLLDAAYELDDAPRWERFYFVSASVAFDTAPIREAVDRVAGSGDDAPPATLRLGSQFTQASLLLVKVPRADGSAGVRNPSVRPLDDCASGTLTQARARSRTVGRLLNVVADSDIVAYVECAWLDPASPQGTLTWLGRTTDRRLVRIRLSLKLSPNRRIEMLGHELQHASEVARAPWVDGDDDIARLYSQIGRRTSTRDTYETTEAGLTEFLVRRELSAGRAASASLQPSVASEPVARAGAEEPAVSTLAVSVAAVVPGVPPLKR